MLPVIAVVAGVVCYEAATLMASALCADHMQRPPKTTRTSPQKDGSGRGSFAGPLAGIFANSAATGGGAGASGAPGCGCGAAGAGAGAGGGTGGGGGACGGGAAAGGGGGGGCGSGGGGGGGGGGC